jgi:hypothetical protein
MTDREVLMTKPEAMDVDVEDERPVLTILEAEAYLGELRRYSKARNLPPDLTCLFDRFGPRTGIAL